MPALMAAHPAQNQTALSPIMESRPGGETWFMRQRISYGRTIAQFRLSVPETASAHAVPARNLAPSHAILRRFEGRT